MVVSDLRFKDNSIIYIYRAFICQTADVLGVALEHNCQFPQGEGTSKESADSLHEGKLTRRPISIEAVNRRANGALV